MPTRRPHWSLFACLRRHDAIHLFVRITSIEVAHSNRQHRRWRMSPWRCAGGVCRDLVSIKADLYRFELQLEEYDGSWIVRRADWQRADVRALLPH